jgi:UDPglucose 6-dehydrogenase
LRRLDPVATEAARRQLPAAWFESGKLELSAHQYEAVANADALALVTEWKPFRPPPRQVRAAGFEYFGIGRK